MGLLRRRRTSPASAVPVDLTASIRAALPRGFEAAAEALADESGSVVDACWVVGRRQAEAGASLGECLEGLRSTTQLVCTRDPEFGEMHALGLGWSEETLAYLHRLSCHDPVTGLATHAHLRERISELYRDAVARRHALVVTEASPRSGGDPVAVARSLALLGRTARTVFGAEPIAQVGRRRVVVVAPRDDKLPNRVSLLRRMTDQGAGRVWIEGLPDTDEYAATLLDELARGA